MKQPGRVICVGRQAYLSLTCPGYVRHIGQINRTRSTELCWVLTVTDNNRQVGYNKNKCIINEVKGAKIDTSESLKAEGFVLIALNGQYLPHIFKVL